MTIFDSLSYAQRLRESGVPAEQAETEVALIRDEVVANAASKDDILSLASRLEQHVELLGQRIERTEERLTHELKRQGLIWTAELKKHDQALSVASKRLEDTLGSEMRLLEQKMTIKIYATMAVAVTLIVALQRLLAT